MEQDPEPEKGAKIVVWSARRSKRSADEADPPVWTARRSQRSSDMEVPSVLAARRSKRSADKEDPPVRLLELRVLHPQEMVEVPLAQILENISGKEANMEAVEVEVTSFYRDILSQPSQLYKV